MKALFSKKKQEDEFLTLLLDGHHPPQMLTEEESKRYRPQTQKRSKIEPTIGKRERKDGYMLGPGEFRVVRKVKEEGGTGVKLRTKKEERKEERKDVWNKR